MAVNVLSRSDAAADVPADTAKLMIEGAQRTSAALQLFRQVPMNRRQERIRVESALPLAYFVNGDTGLKQTTKMAWADKLLIAEEIACIIPIAENVIDDADYDLWAAIMPDAQEAIGKALDDAVLFNIGKPATWPSAIVTAAAAVPTGAVSVNYGTATQAQGGIAQDFSDLYSKIEGFGFDVSGVIASRQMRGFVRSARSTQGVQLNDFGPGQDSIWGAPIVYGARGSWPVGGASGNRNPIAIAGDYSQGILGVRKDITAKMLDQAVIQDPATGEIAYNLAQQDMVALRLTCRFAFQVSNYVTWEQGTEANRYPFGILNGPAVP